MAFLFGSHGKKVNICPVENGGTNANTVAKARNNLGLGDTDEALPVANGGTGAANATNARSNLGATSRRAVATTKTSYKTSAPTLSTDFANVLWGPITVSVNSNNQATVALSTFAISGYTLLAVTSVKAGRSVHSIEGFETDENNLSITYDLNGASLPTTINVNCLYVKTNIINQ